jgi:23S rRNA (adenine2503-C2)-methyltransferase
VQKLRTPSLDERRKLADYDARALGDYLAAMSGCDAAKGRRVAVKALHHAFVDDDLGDACWDDSALKTAGIGAWARPALLRLSLAPSLSIAERAPSSDGTMRVLFRTEDGGLVESVIIPTEVGRDYMRTTLCVSSQVGCARACSFCETGTLGLTRQLTAGEIVDQYRIMRRLCETADRPMDERSPSRGPAPPRDRPGRRRRAAERPVSNIVFMGMGEPMDNLDHVVRAIDLLCDQRVFAFAQKRVTVSTVGVADRLQEFFDATRAELAISLNAPDDQRRNRIMPINERFNLAALKSALMASLPPRRRVLFQYAIFADFNDSPQDADQVADFVESIPCRVNVIPANPGPDPSLVAPTPERVDAFVAQLKRRGVTALVRRPRGRDVGGACGQLAGSGRPTTESLVQLGARADTTGSP